MSAWRKYATSIALDWQGVFAYRANAVVWILVDALPAFTMILVWLAVFRGQEEIGGYTLPKMVTYYLIATFLAAALTPHMEYGFGDEVRTGKLSQALVRPIHRFWQLILGETAWQGMRMIMSLPIFGLGAWLLRGVLEWPSLGAAQVVVLAAALICAYAIQVFIKMSLALLSFWVTEMGGLASAYATVAMLLQGELIPLSLLPHWLQHVGLFLPFRFAVAVPVALAQGQITGAEAWSGVAMAAGWALVLMGVALALWRRGLASYSAVGG